MERNELCWCGSGKKYKKCHMLQDDRLLVLEAHGHIVPDKSILKTEYNNMNRHSHPIGK